MRPDRRTLDFRDVRIESRLSSLLEHRDKLCQGEDENAEDVHDDSKQGAGSLSSGEAIKHLRIVLEDEIECG